MYQVDPDITTEALRASPAIAVTSLSVFGVGLQDWLIVITIVYTVLQVIFLLRDKWWNKRKARKERHGRE